MIRALQNAYLSVRLSILIWHMDRAINDLREANATNVRTADRAAAMLTIMQYDPEKRNGK